MHQRENLLDYYKKYKIELFLRVLAVLFILFLLTSYTSIQTWFYKKPQFKGIQFEKQTNLASSNFTKEKFKEIDTYLNEEAETTSMIVLENG